MKCPYCGAEVPEGDLYCGECGRKIEAAPPSAALAKKKSPVIPVAIGVGVVLCVCVAIVGVIAIPNLIPKATATAVVVLPTLTMSHLVRLA